MGHGRLGLEAARCTMDLRSVWDLGPAAEKLARKCLKLLDSSLAVAFFSHKELRKVSPVLPGDVLAKFLHGSANYFLSSSKL